MGRRICLVGFSELSRNWANEQPDDPAAVAMVKGLAQKHKNAYASHDAEYGVVWFQEGSYGRTPHHMAFLGRSMVPVYIQEVDERIPASVRFPYEAATESLGLPDITGKKRLYLTSSVAWMLALALYEHKCGQTITELRMAGIEMLIGTEYARQKPCV